MPVSSLRISRRRLVQGALLLPAGSGAAVTEAVVRLGQSTALTGPLAAPAAAFNDGANACFEQVNRLGGVNGRRIALRTLDDGYDPTRTSRNVKSLIEDEKVIALFGVLGVPNNAAALSLATEAKVPLLFPMNGDAAIRRTPTRYLFTGCASFEDEIEKLVEHAATLGHRQLAVAHLSNPFGQAIRLAAESAAGRHGLGLPTSGTFSIDGTGLQGAVVSIVAANPTVIVLGAVAGSAVAFIRTLREAGSRAQILTFSGVGVDILVKELGDGSRGIVVSQIVPFPWSPAIPVVRDYQALMPAGAARGPSHLGLWGYISARLAVEGLRRAGKDLSSERLVEALEGMKRLDLGQYVVEFSPQRHHGSRYVDLTIIGPDGKLMK